MASLPRRVIRAAFIFSSVVAVARVRPRRESASSTAAEREEKRSMVSWLTPAISNVAFFPGVIW